MKTAKEMFEELGYEQLYNNSNYVKYEQIKEFCHIQYTFYVPNYCFEKNAFVSGDKPEPAPIFSNELKAINQQCLELGWEEV